jgi:Kef-type K+ transport system membrane component KefB
MLLENFHSPLARLLLQFIVIILATRMLGSLFARFGQPAVIGEITAGILLGPSLFGWLWPGAADFIFSKDSLGVLQLFSQIGVCGRSHGSPFISGKLKDKCRMPK